MTESRRIAIHSDDDGSIVPTKSQHLRSLYLAAINGNCLWAVQNFRLLRVVILEGNGIETPNEALTTGIGSLIHLRYLRLYNTGITQLPSSIGNLCNLLTLDYRRASDSPALKIPDVVWKMEGLTHLYLPFGNYYVEVEEEEEEFRLRLHTLKYLQTLNGIKGGNWMLEELPRLTSTVQKLRIIHGIKSNKQLDAAFQCPSIRSDTLHSLGLDWFIGVGHSPEGEDVLRVESLEQILHCQHLRKLFLKGRIEERFGGIRFPTSIKKLELAYTDLKEEATLANLGKLPNLIVLQLRYDSYRGSKWTCTAGDHFPRLQELCLHGLKELEEWSIERGAMPLLTKLTVDYCQKLRRAPEGLKYITTLKEVHLGDMLIQSSRAFSYFLREFSLDELREATDNFSNTLKIGEGGFGSVYKGTIKPDKGRVNPTVVAIKRYKTNERSGLKAHKEWLTAFHIHRAIDHPNLVQLIGYCSVDGKRGIERILIYQYMPNKSLHDHLLDIHLPALSWRTRLQIMLGAAEGLAYLHEGLEVPIIHWDFKPSNVYLDENFRAKLSGPEIAQEGPTGDQSYVSAELAGTMGYIAPEYLLQDHVSPKCDIYSYGVVLYQVLTGRRAYDFKQLPSAGPSLLEWIKQFPDDKRKIYMIMDSRLQNQYSRSAAVKVAKLADKCTCEDPEDRPSMGEIRAVLGEAILESNKSGGEFNSDSSMDGLQNLPPSESAYDADMGKIIGESPSDLSMGNLNFHPSERQSSTSSYEIMVDSAPRPTEIDPPHLSDYGYPPPLNLKHHYSVQSPNEHPPFSPPSKGDSLLAAEHPHPAPPECSRASPSYGITRDVQPTSISVAHHPHTDATTLENQGADYTEQRLRNRVLDLEKELEGERILFLFGEGCEFEKEMLIQLWMSLGILIDEPMEGIGANYFEKLVSEGYILCSDANSLYKVNAEKLNIDLDMITHKQNYVILDNGSRNDAASAETLHASVVCDEIDALIFKTLGSFNRLRTLLFLGNYGSKLQQVPRDLFLCYGSLAALDLSGTHIKELPSSTGKMVNLRYLDISWTFIEVLPERIDRFEKLQTLKLEGCSRLRRLPKEMKGLTDLRHLHIDVLRQLTTFPEGMGALVNIRTLSAFPVGTEKGLKISELKYMNNIMGEFCIAKIENVQSTDEAKEASLTTKRNISKLKLRWSSYPLQEPRNEDESILKNLCPHADLEEIHILCYPGTNFPDWVGDVSFHKLVSITLFRCVHVSVLPSVEKLPSLKSLELISLNSVTLMDCKGEADHVAFPKLRKLAIDEMLNVHTWAEAQEGDYPSLVELSIKDCPNLLELPSLPYLPSIEHLELSGCTKLAFLSEKELSPSLQQLIVENCPLIEERCSKNGGQDWNMIQHVPTIWIDQVAIQTHEDV